MYGSNEGVSSLYCPTRGDRIANITQNGLFQLFKIMVPIELPRGYSIVCHKCLEEISP